MKKCLQQQDFGPPTVLTPDGFHICLYKKRCLENGNLYHENDDNFCLATGTLIYRRKCGREALETLFHDLVDGSLAWPDLFGHFCLIWNFNGRVRLFTDRMGIYPVWHDADFHIVSSSYLAVLTGLEKRTIDRQGLYEYVLQGSSYGTGSVIREVARFDHNHVLVLTPAGKSLEPATPVERVVHGKRNGQHLERNLANLRRYFEAIAACFGDKVDTALSGGYDSRLTLALLQEQGVVPKVHVYGTEEDGDVRVAKRIAAGTGMALSHMDKSRGDAVSPDRFAKIAEHNFHLFDGYPNDGIFDDGTDLRTRRDRCAAGELMLNGGGGEIFRNFFYLPDRRYTVRKILWLFYSQFDPRVCTGEFSEAAYHGALAAKVMAVLGRDGKMLDRGDVEFVYPAFRCRYWMGRNNAVNNMLGWALTPFIDANIVPDANAVPIAMKNFGRFEATLIQAVSPELAAYPSDYGHDFSGNPPLRRRLKDLQILLRPPILRRYTYRLKRRSRDNWPYLLANNYVERVLDATFPYMGKFVHMKRITDAAQYNRICTLEYLFQRFQPAFPEAV